MAGSPNNPPPAPFVSHPSEEELIFDYLRPRILTDTKVNFINEADLYTAGPDDLTKKFPPATARGGENAWYFFTTLQQFRGGSRLKRNVDTGEGTWRPSGRPQPVGHGNRPRIGQRQKFGFERKEDGKRSGWVMVELRLDQNDGTQMHPLVLSKVYGYPRKPKARADDEASAAAGREEDDQDVDAEETAAEAAVPSLKRKEDDEDVEIVDAEETAAEAAVPSLKRKEDDDDVEIVDAEETAAEAARPSLKRKAGDKDPGAETAAASPGREKEATGESAGAATGGELFDDWRASLGAAEGFEAPAEADGGSGGPSRSGGAQRSQRPNLVLISRFGNPPRKW